MAREPVIDKRKLEQLQRVLKRSETAAKKETGMLANFLGKLKQ